MFHLQMNLEIWNAHLSQMNLLLMLVIQGYSPIHFSGGVAFRFIYSNLTGGTYSGGAATKAGISFAADVSGYYQKKYQPFQ